MTVLTLCLLTAFVALGRWQWDRGASKETLWAEFERSAPAQELGSRDLETIARFQRLSLTGEFEPARQFLLDNRSHGGRGAGYEVLTPFRMLDGRRVLVNRGWIPFRGYRDQLPDVSMTAAGAAVISGRVDELPSSGLASGRAPPGTGDTWPKLTSFPSHPELAAALGAPLERRVLLLDADIPGGFVREWSPPGMAPTRHYSYAIQWWGFAVVLVVLYFGLNLRKVS